ncbi:hypothetical protein K2Y00_02065 [Patescibacteria group bacterium]|nr:hypothetical protein [Patescibacteria group bacterium]
MSEKGTRPLGGVPERFKEEGVKVSGNKLAKIGDMVIALHDIQGGLMYKGEQRKITAIHIEPKPHSRGFTKEIELEGMMGERFSPQRFRKAETD